MICFASQFRGKSDISFFFIFLVQEISYLYNKKYQVYVLFYLFYVLFYYRIQVIIVNIKKFIIKLNKICFLLHFLPMNKN